MTSEIFDGFSIGSFTFGAISSWLLGKIIPIHYKEHLANKKDKKKAIANRSSEVCDAVHEIVKKSVHAFCTDFDREVSLKIKTDYHDFSVLINELNNDLKSFGFLDHHVSSSLIINFRQAITGQILVQRTGKYNIDDPLVVNIYEKSESLISTLRQINRVFA